MASDPKKTLGYIALQLRAQKQAADQAAVRQKEQFDREASQQDKQLNVKSIDSAFKNYNEGENRKLQLAGIMSRSAENNELRRHLGEMSDQTKRDIEAGKNEDRDADRGIRKDLGEGSLKLKEGEFGYKKDHDVIKDKQKDYELITGRNANIAKVRGGADVLGVTSDGLLYTDSAVPGSTNTPGGEQTDPAAPPPPKAGRVKDEPTDQKTIDAAGKAYNEGSKTDRAYDRLLKAMEAVPASESGGGNADTYVGIPNKVPYIGGIGLNIPGKNSIEKFMVNRKMTESDNGRNFVNWMRGHPDLGNDQGIKNRVANRNEVESAAKDLSTSIGLEKLGTTSTIKQDEKIDAILGMAGDSAFGQDKELTTNIVTKMRAEQAKTRRVNKYIMEHHAIPMEDLPDEQGSVAQAQPGTAVDPTAPPSVPSMSIEDLFMGNSKGATPPATPPAAPKSDAEQMFDMLKSSGVSQPDADDQVAQFMMQSNPEAKQMFDMLIGEGVPRPDAIEQVRQLLTKPRQKPRDVQF